MPFYMILQSKESESDYLINKKLPCIGQNYAFCRNYNKLYLAVRKDGVFKGHYHDLGAETAKKLPDFLKAPDAIIQLGNGRLNLFSTVTTKRGSNGIISVELNSTKDIGGKNEDYNVVVTMFSSDDQYVKNLIHSDGVTVKYAKEDLPQVNPQLYKWLATINDKSSSDNNTISQNSNVVNNNLSENTSEYTPQNTGTVQEQYRNQLSAEERAAIAETSKALGVEVRIAQSLKGGEADGYYKDGTVYLAMDADDKLMNVFSHEITHHFEDAAPESYAEYKQAVLEILARDSADTARGTDSTVETLIRDKQEKYARSGVNLSTQEVENELVADYTRRILNNPEQFQKFTSHAEHQGFLSRLLEAIREIFAKIKGKSSNLAMMHSLYAIADMGNGRELVKLYVEELNDVNSDGTIKRAYQLQNITKQQLNAKGSEKNILAQSTAADTYTVSQLFDLVKGLDKNFKPNEASKVVNEDGTPKVVYHGTRASFNTFILKPEVEFGRALGDGFYFTENYKRAFRYANGITGKDHGGHIMSVYLDIKKPFYITEQNKMNYGDELNEGLSDGKYDGVIDTRNGTYLVFSSNQIKSATDNIGTFDKGNDDIRYSLKESKMNEDADEENSNIYDYTKSFSEQLDDWQNGKIPRYDTLMIGGTPKVFQKIGFNALPFTINQKHVISCIVFYNICICSQHSR